MFATSDKTRLVMGGFRCSADVVRLALPRLDKVHTSHSVAH
ncbi:hypothetical protein [Phytohabitans aurantiacus]|nr:hypothetical protein [Phytohabitans aurantiacus]